MRKFINLWIVALVFLFSSCVSKTGNKESQEPLPKVTFAADYEAKKIDVLAGGKLFTTFRWTEDICKPVLFPVCASSGTEITRGFPVSPKAGERADHPHQIGMWLTYGNVNGSDFWGNGSKGLGTKNGNGGTIHHEEISDLKEGDGKGSFTATAGWRDSTGNQVFSELTQYYFLANENIRIIDRITTLTAGDQEVQMPDTKEGMFGIRVARELELPAKGTAMIWQSDGTVQRVNDTLNTGITGNYTSSEGITGEEVWSTRARWMNLTGEIGEEKISVVICDHPDNPNYPTYWHARGYGLFSANPLGVKDFTRGEESLNLSIPAKGSVTFKYRVIISSGYHMTAGEIEKSAGEFAQSY